MAYDLTARLRIIDDLTSPLRRATEQVTKTSKIVEVLSGTLGKASGAQEMMGNSATLLTRSIGKFDNMMGITKRTVDTFRDSSGRLRDEFGRFVSSGKTAGGAFNGIANGAMAAKGAVLGLKSAIGGVMGIAAGYGLFRATDSFLTASLGGAANYEMAKVQIEALFQDAEKAQTYMERMSAAAALSPILNEQQVFDNSKSFLALTKNQAVLEDLWKAAEKMNAMDPAQGLEGAVLAIRELSGGDVQSMVERFELPRSVVNSWKNLPIEEQAKAINAYMDSIGFNQDFLERTGKTAAKQWDRTSELFQKSVRIIGQDALTKLKPVLVDINDFLSSPRFDDFVGKAGSAMAEMFDDLIGASRDAWNYVDSKFFSNPAFNNLPDLSAKVSFVIDDLTQSFTDWYNRTGSAQLEMATGRVTKTILDGLETAAPEIAKSALNIGSRIAISMTTGYLEEMKKSIPGQAMLYALPAIDSAANTKGLYDKVMDWMNPAEELKPAMYGPPAPPKVDGAAYHGIDYVPRDGYTTRLHKGETVLPREEAAEYRSGGAGGGVTIEKLADQIVIREEADIERIAYRIAREINAGT